MATFQNIQDEVENGRVTFLNQTYGSIGDAIRNQVTLLKADIDNARGIIDQAKASIDALNIVTGQVQSSQLSNQTVVNRSIQELRKLINTHTATDLVHDRRLNKLNQDIALVKASLTTLETNETSARTLLNGLQAIRADLIPIVNDIEANRINIARNRYDINVLIPKVSKLIIDLTEAKQGLSLLRSSFGLTLAEVRTAVEILENRVDQLPADTELMIQDLQDSVGDLQDRVQYIEEHGTINGGGGGGTGGGGGYSSSTTMTAKNLTGQTTFNIAKGGTCPFSFSWSSLDGEDETGEGELEINVGGKTKATATIEQGVVSLDLGKYCSVGSNTIELVIYDIYGNWKRLRVRVNVADLQLTSTFDPSVIYEGNISFVCKPAGSGSKTLYVILDEGTANEHTYTMTTETSGYDISVSIPQQSHGSHTIRAYCVSIVNEVEITSNELYYEIICIDPYSDTPVLTSSFTDTSVQRYTMISIDYTVYDPKSMTANVDIYVNNQLRTSDTVDQLTKYFRMRMEEVGVTTIKFVINDGELEREFPITVTESDLNLDPVTGNLVYHFTPVGRSNSEDNHAVIRDPDSGILATPYGFNWVTDGWQIDNEGLSVLRINNGAQLEIQYQPFAQDLRATGFTFEIEYRTFQANVPGVVVASCANFVPATFDMSKKSEIIPSDKGWFELINGQYITTSDLDFDDSKTYYTVRGFALTPDKAVFGAEHEDSKITCEFKDEDRMKVTFAVEARNDQNGRRMIYCYNDAKISRAAQYPTTDNFAQPTPVNITIGSPNCGIDIYGIRIYNTNIGDRGVEKNFAADSQKLDEAVDRLTRNSIFADDGLTVDLNKLPGTIPQMTIVCPELSQNKNDTKACTGYFTLNGKEIFHFTGTIVVQGTSSAAYVIKNFTIAAPNGYILNNGKTVNAYTLIEGVHDVKVFCLKADVASSEGANNTVAAMIYDDAAPETAKSAAMLADSTIHSGIVGIPIIMNWDDGNGARFWGKYNMNVDKSDTDFFGFSGDDEVWEFKDNNTTLCAFTSDDFTGDWGSSLEARYPGKKYKDTTQLQAFWSFIVNSLLPSQAPDDNPADTAAMRRQAFKTNFPRYANVDSFIFYFAFMERLKGVDSMMKNLFLGFTGDAITDIPGMRKKAMCYQYDIDTILGSNNEGVLNIPYWAEFRSKLHSGAWAFNGAPSRLWQLIEECYEDEIADMHHDHIAAIGGYLGYHPLINRFEAHQVWPEAVYNLDERTKHINAFTDEDSKDMYLAMVRGDLKYQRRRWYDRAVANNDSKYKDGTNRSDMAQFRAYEAVSPTLKLTPYIDMYVNVSFGSSHPVTEFAHAGQEVTLASPLDWSNDTETYIYGASWMTGELDLSDFYAGTYDGSALSRIRSIKLGRDEAGYINRQLTSATFGSNPALQKVDCRNCVNLSSSIDLSNCSGLEEAYFSGTSVTNMSLPNGGVVKKVHYPATLLTWTMLNLQYLTEVEFTDNRVNVAIAGGDFFPVRNNYCYEAEVTGETATIDIYDTSKTLIDSFELADGETFLTTYETAFAKVVEGTANVYASKYANITTVRLENNSTTAVDIKDVIMHLSPRTRVRLVDIVLDNTTFEEVDKLWNRLDQMTGITANYDNVAKAQVSGTIYLDDVTGEELESIARYPDVTVVFGHSTSKLTYKTWDGTSTLHTDVIVDGGDGTYAGEPPRVSDAANDYTFAGWSLTPGGAANQNATKGVSANRTVYAAYVARVRSYEIKWMNTDGTLLGSEMWTYGSLPSYTGTVPVDPTGEDTFKRWTPAITAVSGPATYTAQYKNICTVSFVNADGTVLQAASQVYENEIPVYNGETPVDPAGNNDPFTGWNPAIGPVTVDTVYTATFQLRYNVTFLDSNGMVLETKRVNAGATPTYSQGTPTDPSGYNDPFLRWTPTPGPLSANATYTAVYQTRYNITFKNVDGTVLETKRVNEGSTPTYSSSADPVDPSGNNDRFLGWSPTITVATADAIYTATYETRYDITFRNTNNNLLGTVRVNAGVTPEYTGQTPVDPSGNNDPFVGWTPELVPAGADMTYMAVYQTRFNAYFYNGGTKIGEDRVAADETPEYTGETPVDPSGNNDPFDGWTPDLAPINQNTDFTAKFKTRYNATFVNSDGSPLTTIRVLPTETPAYPSASDPVDPLHNPGWTFTGWNPPLAPINSNTTFTAQYTLFHTVTFKNDDGTTLETKQVADGTTPTYTGNTPVDPFASETFTGWLPALGPVTADTEYIASYGGKIAVIFKNSDSTVLQRSRYAAGETPNYTGSTPVDPTGANRVFKAWSPAISVIVGNEAATVEYTATYKAKLTVTWMNSNGTTLTTTTVNEGDTPVYSGATPVDPSGAGMTFDGWSPAIGPISANTTYTATYLNPVQITDRTADVNTFFTALENNNVQNSFQLGNYFTINLGSTYGTALNAQIVGFGKKSMPDGTPSQVDIIFKEQLLTTHKMNETNTTEGGWAASGMRSWLSETGSGSVWSAIPDAWRKHIIPVVNYSKVYNGDANAETVDKLSIPSQYELNFTGYETTGANFSALYPDTTSRIKNRNGSAQYYWTRSASNSADFRIVYSGGGASNYSASSSYGVVLGFSLGSFAAASAISDSWSGIFAAEAAGTYTKYAAGMTKSIDLGSEGIVTFEVAGHNLDELADGTGTAATTWIAKIQLPTTHAMNSSATTAGGYAATSMRDYIINTILPKFPEEVRNAMVEVKKYTGYYENSAVVKDVESSEKLWILSNREVFNNTNYEAKGPTYSAIFPDQTSRIRKRNGSANYYWLRSASSSTYFRDVYSNGNANYDRADISNGVVLGFCTGTVPSN